MKKNNFFEIVRNFLATWAGIHVSIFLYLQIGEMGKVFVKNIPNALARTTDGRVLLVTMLVSLVTAIVVRAIEKAKKE